jgi:hypothetical protein
MARILGQQKNASFQASELQFIWISLLRGQGFLTENTQGCASLWLAAQRLRGNKKSAGFPAPVGRMP